MHPRVCASQQEKPTHHSLERSPCSLQLEKSLHAATKTQHRLNKYIIFLKKVKERKSEHAERPQRRAQRPQDSLQPCASHGERSRKKQSSWHLNQTCSLQSREKINVWFKPLGLWYSALAAPANQQSSLSYLPGSWLTACRTWLETCPHSMTTFIFPPRMPEIRVLKSTDVPSCGRDSQENRAPINNRDNTWVSIKIWA